MCSFIQKEGLMSSRFRIAILGGVLVILTALIGVSAQGADPFTGTWKINLAKSTYSPGPPPKSSTFKYEPSEGGLKRTQDQVDAQGQATHTEVLTKFDGKDYKVQGAATNNTVALKRIDDRTFEATGKTDGKVTTITRVVVSRDGKTMTSTQTGKNAQGQTVNNIMVRDKQ